jgi:hypothetical protein
LIGTLKHSVKNGIDYEEIAEEMEDISRKQLDKKVEEKILEEDNRPNINLE